MLFARETDYHGSRRYEGAQSVPALAEHLRLRVTLTFAWAGLLIRNLLRFGAGSPRTSTIVDHGEKHFTLLGVRPPAVPARSISDIFPIPAPSNRPRGGTNDNSRT
jgi:hypothetical protein